jgi:hypothetical protein
MRGQQTELTSMLPAALCTRRTPSSWSARRRRVSRPRPALPAAPRTQCPPASQAPPWAASAGEPQWSAPQSHRGLCRRSMHNAQSSRRITSTAISPSASRALLFGPQKTPACCMNILVHCPECYQQRADITVHYQPSNTHRQIGQAGRMLLQHAPLEGGHGRLAIVQQRNAVDRDDKLVLEIDLSSRRLF